VERVRDDPQRASPSRPSLVQSVVRHDRGISAPISRRRSSASTRRSSASRTTSRKANRRPRAPTRICVRPGRKRERRAGSLRRTPRPRSIGSRARRWARSQSRGNRGRREEPARRSRTLRASSRAFGSGRTRVDEEATNARAAARESADSARTRKRRVANACRPAEARAARVETERAHLIRESDELRLGDEERSAARADEDSPRVPRPSRKSGASASRRTKPNRGGSRARSGEGGRGSRAAESAAERAGAARNELQRSMAISPLSAGRPRRSREAVDRADAELAAARGRPGAATAAEGIRLAARAHRVARCGSDSARAGRDRGRECVGRSLRPKAAGASRRGRDLCRPTTRPPSRRPRRYAPAR